MYVSTRPLVRHSMPLSGVPSRTDRSSINYSRRRRVCIGGFRSWLSGVVRSLARAEVISQPILGAPRTMTAHLGHGGRRQTECLARDGYGTRQQARDKSGLPSRNDPRRPQIGAPRRGRRRFRWAAPRAATLPPATPSPRPAWPVFVGAETVPGAGWPECGHGRRRQTDSPQKSRQDEKKRRSDRLKISVPVPPTLPCGTGGCV